MYQMELSFKRLLKLYKNCIKITLSFAFIINYALTSVVEKVKSIDYIS